MATHRALPAVLLLALTSCASMVGLNPRPDDSPVSDATPLGAQILGSRTATPPGAGTGAEAGPRADANLRNGRAALTPENGDIWADLQKWDQPRPLPPAPRRRPAPAGAPMAAPGATLGATLGAVPVAGPAVAPGGAPGAAPATGTAMAGATTSRPAAQPAAADATRLQAAAPASPQARSAAGDHGRVPAADRPPLKAEAGDIWSDLR